MISRLVLNSFLLPNREFRFTCEVPIRLDYHGKHVSMEQVGGQRAQQIHSIVFYLCVMNGFCDSVPGNFCRDHYRVDSAQLFRAEAEALVLQTGVCSSPYNIINLSAIV